MLTHLRAVLRLASPDGYLSYSYTYMVLEWGVHSWVSRKFGSNKKNGRYRRNAGEMEFVSVFRLCALVRLVASEKGVSPERHFGR